MGLLDFRIGSPRNPLAQIIFYLFLVLVIGALLFASLGFREYAESILRLLFVLALITMLLIGAILYSTGAK